MRGLWLTHSLYINHSPSIFVSPHRLHPHRFHFSVSLHILFQNHFLQKTVMSLPCCIIHASNPFPVLSALSSLDLLSRTWLCPSPAHGFFLSAYSQLQIIYLFTQICILINVSFIFFLQ